jgi:hypothetical protein
MQTQAQAQIAAIYREWVTTVVPTHFPNFLDSQNNANMLYKYLQEAGEDYSLAALTNAATDLRHSLESKTSEMIAAAQAAKARAEEQRRQAQKNVEVVNFWLKNHAPLALLGASGEPFAGDIDRFIEFVNRNYNGVFSIEALNAAVAVLSPVLTWFSDEDRELRNVPPPPPRHLSEQARRDAGLLPVKPNGPQSHVDDQAALTPQEIARQTREAIFKKLGMPTEEQEWQNKAEALQIMGKKGVNWRETDELRKIKATDTRTGKVNWKETYRLRYIAAENAERHKNR